MTFFGTLQNALTIKLFCIELFFVKQKSKKQEDYQMIKN